MKSPEFRNFFHVVKSDSKFLDSRFFFFLADIDIVYTCLNEALKTIKRLTI